VAICRFLDPLVNGLLAMVWKRFWSISQPQAVADRP
jgi:hypothetical protein